MWRGSRHVGITKILGVASCEEAHEGHVLEEADVRGAAEGLVHREQLLAVELHRHADEGGRVQRGERVLHHAHDGATARVALWQVDRRLHVRRVDRDELVLVRANEDDVPGRG